MGNKSKFSAFGLPLESRVDQDALSDVAAGRVFHLRPGPRTTPFTASSTVRHNFGAIGRAGIVTGAYISAGVLPNIATSATVALAVRDKSANADIAITDAFDVEDTTTALVAREANAMTLAATNVAVEADDTFEVVCVAGGAITTNATDLCVTVLFEPSEDAVIVD